MLQIQPYELIFVLKKFQCQTDQFGCDDGSCISMVLRCNDVKDCNDYTDESNCTLFRVDANVYRKEYPPMNSSRIPTPVVVSVTINSIGKLE